MIEGVRMRLFVTVWNNTVETAIEYATSTMAASLVPRKDRMKDQLPFAPTVMNAATASRVSTERSERIKVGRLSKA
jgi:hypothetical protein